MKAAVLSSRNAEVESVQADGAGRLDAELKGRPAKSSRRALLAFSAFFLLLGLGLRLESLRTTAPNADEQHWVDRSAVLSARVLMGDWQEATTHLGHPGIPAAIVMALAQNAAKSWNEALGAAPYSSHFLDPLSASRIGCALVSFLVLLVLLFTSSELIGFSAVVLGTMFLALDCQALALSRVAHIDGVLTLLVTISLLAGFAAERERDPRKKIFAGIFWGLAIATKPTALAVVGILLVYKFFRRVLCSRFTGSPSPLLEWSDLWAVFAGHVVLGSLYTKLWITNNTYLSKHHIYPPLSDLIMSLGEYLHHHSALVFVLAAAIAIDTFLLRKKSGRLRYHLQMAFAFAGAVTLAIWFAPITVSNLVRFWYWVGGLSHRNHEAYGMVITEPPGMGYPEIWLRRLPSIALCGALVAIPFLVKKFRAVNSLREAEETAFLLILLAAPVIWTIPLSVSSKQTVRYLAPMYPEIFLFAAWGIVQLWNKLIPAVAGHSPRRQSLASLGFISLFLVEAGIARSWTPNYSLYFNRLTGGIPAALERGFALNPVSYEPVITMLRDKGAATNDVQRLEVFGDVNLMKYEYVRLYPKKFRAPLDIHAYRDGYGADWLLVFSSYAEHREADFENREVFEPVLEYNVHGGTVYTLYRVLAYDFSTPLRFPVRHGAHRMGYIKSTDGEGSNVIAEPDTARAGYIQFDQYARLKPGRYRVKFAAAKLPQADSAPNADPDQEALRVELSSACTRTVPFREINSLELQTIELQCEFTQETRAQISVYWFGVIPLRLGDTTIERIQ